MVKVCRTYGGRAIVILLVLTALVVIMPNNKSGQSRDSMASLDSTESTNSPVSTPSASASSVVDLPKERNALTGQVVGFVGAFYSRSTTYSAATAKTWVASYATTTFMSANASSFGMSEADRVMAREKSRLLVEIISRPIGEFSADMAMADVDARLRFTKYDNKGRVVIRYERTQSMFLVKDDEGIWRVDKLIDSSS